MGEDTEVVDGIKDKGGRGRGGSRDRDGGQTPDGSSARKVLAFGLSLVGFGDGRQTCREDLCLRRFRAHYGVDPRAIKALNADLERSQPETPLHPLHLPSLFMTISWLKLYVRYEGGVLKTVPG
eukprot:CAMPEP_0201967764 /NCGR_PEP_ID=MMETSP0904-20121228/12354_1 /ASSEMBLY_ACC=CAM_ASM_000553 /TAXON_ID=420261 /ORGANISM="Thalassiosira antarctica, Strain CCMP982" /LENGTH=123 /DNA_ID=CAMNT_0048515293 /DNA_START=198 /DNA_END=565 /DNA_ORIENTATION=-